MLIKQEEAQPRNVSSAVYFGPAPQKISRFSRSTLDVEPNSEEISSTRRRRGEGRCLVPLEAGDVTVELLPNSLHQAARHGLGFKV